MRNQKALRAVVGRLLLLWIGITAGAEVAGARADGSISNFPTLKTGEKIAVIGVRKDKVELNEEEKKNLAQPMIGFGISERIAQELSNSGKFALVESDLQMSPLFAGLIRTSWVSRDKDYSVTELSEGASQVGTKVVAYGSVSYSASYSDDWGVGIFTTSTDTLQIGVKVCLYEVTSRISLCRESSGEAVRKESGFLYQPRDDNRGFMQDAVGIATDQAVTRAVQNVLAAVRFSP